MRKHLLFIALLLVPSRCFAQGSAYTAGPFSSSGWLYVCPVPSGGTPCPSPSSIFSNAALTTPITQPLFIPAGSTVSFFLAAGQQYTVQFPATGYSQIVGAGGGVSPVSSLPATCSVGVTAPVQLTVAPYAIYVCTATNTWGPSTAPSGSTGQVQFNNNGALAGTGGILIAAGDGVTIQPTTTGPNPLNVKQFSGGPAIIAIFSPSGGGNVCFVTTGSPGNINCNGYATSTNCTSSASPAVCGSAAAGSVVVAAAATTVQVNTTAVTANSQILLTRDDSLGTKLSVTCNTATVMGEMKVSARTSGSNFTITVQTTPVTNPGCISYSIIN